MIVKKRKNEKKRSFVLFWNIAKKNEYNRSSTIEDLPLLNTTPPPEESRRKAGRGEGVPGRVGGGGGGGGGGRGGGG